MQAVFGNIGDMYNKMYGGPVLSYPAKFAAFGIIQYNGAKTEFLNPKGDPESIFTVNGGGYVYINGKRVDFAPDDFGNYFYGVAARSMGVTLDDAIKGAGIYAILSGSKIDWTNWYGLFDERKDTKFIIRGYYGQ